MGIGRILFFIDVVTIYKIMSYELQKMLAESGLLRSSPRKKLVELRRTFQSWPFPQGTLGISPMRIQMQRDFRDTTLVFCKIESSGIKRPSISNPFHKICSHTAAHQKSSDPIPELYQKHFCCLRV